MSLAYEVLRFVDRVRQNSADGGDPRLIGRLEKIAKEAFEGIVALHAPASPMTWEVVTVLRGNTLTGPRQGFRFPRPVEIVGFLPTVLPTLPASGGAVIPTTDTIAVSIDTDNQNYMTTGDGVSTIAGGTAGPFVTLTTLGVQVPRVVGYKLRNPTPDIGFTYRWRVDPTGGPFFRDVIIGMAIYARYL